MHLLFDLDGTLTDPFPGITKSIQHALVSLGFSAPPAQYLRWCIGPPLQESFEKLVGRSLVDVALAKYREGFSSGWLFENNVYSGIEEALNELLQQGHTLGVATSKPTVYAKRIIDHFSLAQYFQSVDGSELDGTRQHKGDLIAYLLNRDGLDASDVVMIGDRKHDILGARQNGVAGLGVLWGYGSREELEKAGAYDLIESPSDLLIAINRSNTLIEVAS